MRTAAQDSVLRLALSMAMADPTSALTNVQRSWIRDRLQVVDQCGQHVPLGAAEVARLRGLVLAYVEEYRPGIAGIVCRSLEEPAW